MSVGSIGGAPAAQTKADAVNAARPDSRDADAFSDAVKDQGTKSKDSKDKETSSAELLAEARRNLLLSTARQMQEAAKDIERDNIDKGF